MEGLTLIVAAGTIKPPNAFAWHAKWAISSKWHRHLLEGESFSFPCFSKVESTAIFLRSRKATKEQLFKSSFYILNSKRVHIILVCPLDLVFWKAITLLVGQGILHSLLLKTRARGNAEFPIQAWFLTNSAKSPILAYLAASLLLLPFACKVKQNSWQHSLILKIYRRALFLQNIFQPFLSTFGWICGNNLPWIFLSPVSF